MRMIICLRLPPIHTRPIRAPSPLRDIACDFRGNHRMGGRVAPVFGTQPTSSRLPRVTLNGRALRGPELVILYRAHSLDYHYVTYELHRA